MNITHTASKDESYNRFIGACNEVLPVTLEEAYIELAKEVDKYLAKVSSINDNNRTFDATVDSLAKKNKVATPPSNPQDGILIGSYNYYEIINSAAESYRYEIKEIVTVIQNLLQDIFKLEKNDLTIDNIKIGQNVYNIISDLVPAQSDRTKTSLLLKRYIEMRTILFKQIQNFAEQVVINYKNHELTENMSDLEIDNVHLVLLSLLYLLIGEQTTITNLLNQYESLSKFMGAIINYFQTGNLDDKTKDSLKKYADTHGKREILYYLDKASQKTKKDTITLRLDKDSQ